MEINPVSPVMNVDERSNNSGPPNWDDEVFNVDWNEDAGHPSIDYTSDPAASEFEKSSGKIVIEDIVTPIKPVSPEVIVDEETVGYNYQIDDFSFITQSALDNKLNSGNNDYDQFDCPAKKVKRVRPKLSQEEKEELRISKEQKKLMKEKSKEDKKAEQIRQKALKVALLENKRNLKPEENIKFLKVHIDNEVINSVYGGNIISILQQNGIKFVVETQVINCTITWTKKKVEKLVNDEGVLTEKTDIVDEEPMLYILGWEKAVELVHNNELLTHVEMIKSAYTNKKLTLIIYEMGKYFECKKNIRNRDRKAEVCDKKKPKSRPYERVFEEAPNISRDQLEFVLTDLQILGRHNCRLLETPDELSALVLNFTKSLSQIEYKLDWLKRQEGDLGCFLASNSNQCVKIDKNRNGFMHLWQQQICQFSSVGIETAQAVVSHFASPAALVNQYKKCMSAEEGELLLEDIQIRREAGVLSSSRRIGPQLSKKIYNFFTSDDPNLEL